MGDEIEAMGTLATAGAVAHAIDHERGRHGEAHGTCLNCDAPLDGRFCRECGQPAHLHRSLGHVAEEFVHGLLHVDTKAWRTLPMLAFRPGRLTREYVHGKRARYIAPFALFLFTVFIMYFVFAMIGGPHFGEDFADQSTRAERIADARQELADARAELRKSQADLAAAKQNPDSDAGDIGSLNGEVTAAQAAVIVAQGALQRAEAQPADKPVVRKTYKTWQEGLRAAVESGDLNVDLGNAELNARARKALLNPDFTLYKVQQKAYKLSFLLVPLSLPFLWLLFPFRRSVNLYDHAVFALYSLSFMSLLFVAMTLLSKAGSWGEQLAGLLFFVPPVHMYAQLKGAYSLGWLGAAWRTFWLLAFATIVLSLYVVFIVFLGMVD